MKAKRLLCSAILAASLFATNANAIGVKLETAAQSFFNDQIGKFGNAFLGVDYGALIGGKTVGFSLLGVETKALISSFDPTKKDGGAYDVNNNEISDVSLEGALNYLRTNKMVLPDINLYNVYKKENLYKYQEEEVIRTR